MLTLYYSPGACSLAPHILLEELDLPFEAKCLDMARGDLRGRDFTAINPKQRVPVVVSEQGAITEAPAILLHLGALKPGKMLLPDIASYSGARILEFMAFLSSTLHIAYAQFWRPQRFVDDGFRLRGEFAAQGKDRIAEANAEIEQRISGPWAVGESYSLADIYLFPFYRWGVRVGLPMEEACPRWTRWKDRMLTRPAVRTAIEREGIGFEWEPAG